MPDPIGADNPLGKGSTDSLISSDTASMVIRLMFGVLLFLIIPFSLAFMVWTRTKQAVGAENRLPSINRVAE